MDSWVMLLNELCAGSHWISISGKLAGGLDGLRMWRQSAFGIVFFAKCLGGLVGQGFDDGNGDFGKNGGPVHDEPPFEKDWERRKVSRADQ